MQLAGLSLLALFSSLLLCRLVMAFAPKDAPDGGRKTQSFAVPTSGGLAIAAAILISWLGLLTLAPDIAHSPELEHFGNINGKALICFSLAGLLIGGLDDQFSIPAKPKFIALAIASGLAATLGIYIDGVFLPVADAYFPIATWLGIGGTALWFFVFMNATNFMDGSNGLAMGTLAIMLGSISIHLYGHDHFHDLSVLGTLMVAAILGFLFWNLQGKLYAGDAGSLFGGAVFASLGIYAAQDGNIWFPATLALPFLVDVFMTLIWRAQRGHNLLTPHRHHAYQLFIRSGWGHIKTALLWWSFAVFCAAAALWAASDSKAMSAYVFLGMLGLGVALWLIHRARTKLIHR